MDLIKEIARTLGAAAKAKKKKRDMVDQVCDGGGQGYCWWKMMATRRRMAAFIRDKGDELFSHGNVKLELAKKAPRQSPREL